MPNLTQTDINALQALADARDVIGYYNYLTNKGDLYAPLARGVVEGNTSNGAAARQFAQNYVSFTGG